MIEGKFMEPSPMKPLAKIRTDVVGSLLRPAQLKQAYLQRDQGKIGDDELRRIEDEAIRKAVELQEAVGLDVVTDGEFRRLNFQDSFAASVSGFDARPTDLSFMESLSREGKPLQRWDPYHVAHGAAILQRRPAACQSDTGRTGSHHRALRLPKFEIGLLEYGRLRCRRGAH